MPHDPFDYALGVYEVDGPMGRTRHPIVFVLQRRLSRDGKTETWIVFCPYSLKLAEHGAGEGFRGPHCGPQYEDRRDYYLPDASDMPLIKWPNSAIRVARGEYR